MKILYKQKIVDIINTIDDLENFLIKNNIYSYFKKIHMDYYSIVESAISKTESLNYKQIKPWLRNILDYPESLYNPLFLKCMGWDENDINSFISKKQRDNSEKMSINKKNNPEKYSASTNTKIGYWLNKGFDEETAIKKISERQSTFSKKTCIEKYGEELGLLKFTERQKKWITTLSQRNDYQLIQISKNSYDYVNKQFDELVCRSSFLEKTKETIINGMNCENIECFVDYVISNLDLKKYSELIPYINSKIIHQKFNTQKEILKEKFVAKLPFNPFESKYGTFIYHNKVRFKSLKEYNLALFLELNNINYIYEVAYPNSSRKCDFYLPKYNLYIEYFGMLDNKSNIKEGSIFDFYQKKMEDKIQYCFINKIHLIYDVNLNKLIEKIKLIIYEN
jgi:hypothetical protein